MKTFILLAGAAALGIAAPAAADPGHGRGHQQSHWNAHQGRHDNGNHYGQVKHQQRWNRGQRWRSNYGTVYSYNRIPVSVRHRYNLNSRKTEAKKRFSKKDANPASKLV